jgi:hypothetical protein
MKTLLHIIILLSLSATAAQAKTLSLGVDVSGSNPLLFDEHFAYTASQYVSAQILPLKNGDVVRIKTFGGRANSVNMLTTEYVISRRLKAKKVAAIVAQYVQSLPNQKMLSQSSTNLIAWLEFTNGFHCTKGGQILAITDGLETADVDGQAFLDGKQGLPEADVDLKGCALTFYGLGAGWPGPSVKFVRNEWRKWAKQAGASFTAIIP